MRLLFFILLPLLLLLLQQAARCQFKYDSTKNVNVAAVPVINYDRALGGSFGILAQVFYKLNPEDTVSPSSSSGIFGMYTTNKTYFAAAFQKLYFDEDNWRVMAALGLGSINYQYWQELPVVGGDFIGFNTEATFALGRIERRVYKKLYAGINGIYSRVKTEFDVPDFFPDSLRLDERNLNSLGYLLNFDMRDNQINPYTGFNIEFKNYFYRGWMSNDNNFEKFQLTYNHYHSLKNERHVLATRFKAAIATGDVPFQGQNVVGQDDIRGYSSGKYRDNQVYALQAEYRWRFYKKFGLVGFAGLATAMETIGDIGGSELLPGAGVGFRFMAIPKERINIGFDVAVGKDDWGIYFRIGEAFGR
jgi:hypothetical protein